MKKFPTKSILFWPQPRWLNCVLWLTNTPYEFYKFWDNLWHHKKSSNSFAHFLTDPPTIPCVNRVMRVMRVTCQRVADAHRLWGATSSPTKFHLSSCHASSFCNNLASLALQLMEREPIIQHFGFGLKSSWRRNTLSCDIWRPASFEYWEALVCCWRGGGHSVSVIHLLINSAILLRANKWLSEGGGCSMVLLWQLEYVCIRGGVLILNLNRPSEF